MEVLFVSNGKLLHDATAGGDLYLLDLISGLRGRDVTPFLAYPEDDKPERLHLRRYRADGSYDDRIFERPGNPEAAFRDLLGAFPGRIVHFQHFQTLPLSLFAAAREAGKQYLITIHDYFLWCQNFFLLSPLRGELPAFCSFEADASVCASCLNASSIVKERIYGGLWKDGFHTASSVQARRTLTGSILGRAARLVAPTAAVRENLLSRCPDIDPERFMVVEHGVARSGSLPQQRARGRGDSLNAAFLGGFKFEKGSAYFNEIISRDWGGAVSFSVIGNVTAPLAPAAASRVRVLGRYQRAALPDILRREGIDVVLLLSPWPETYSYTLTEAILNGIPVIATDTGAFRERVALHGAGFLVPYENPVPRVVHLLQDLWRNPAALDYFRARCSDAVQAVRDVAAMVSDYEGIYKDISQEDGP